LSASASGFEFRAHKAAMKNCEKLGERRRRSKLKQSYAIIVDDDLMLHKMHKAFRSKNKE
jgi:hypothetical protein